MSFVELLLIAVSLAMDAFAVSVCLGISEKRHTPLRACRPAGLFAIFQTGMPLLGYALGSTVAGNIGAVGRYVAFLLLVFIGGKMIWDAFHDGGDEGAGAANTLRLLLMAVATSIDALAVGLSFSFLSVNVWTSAVTIGSVTFVTCFVGYYLGGRIGALFQKRAMMAGGVTLVALGIKILIESFVR